MPAPGFLLCALRIFSMGGFLRYCGSWRLAHSKARCTWLAGRYREPKTGFS